jgi:hypothetical protein
MHIWILSDRGFSPDPDLLFFLGGGGNGGDLVFQKSDQRTLLYTIYDEMWSVKSFLSTE